MSDSYDPASHSKAPSLRWLALGAMAGLVVAAWGLLEKADDTTPLPDGAIARVNDTVVDAQRHQRAIDLLAATLGREPSDEEKLKTLQQLIDEELLVQRGIELNMAASETTVRSAIVQSLVASVTAEADAADPDDAELERFLAENADDYTFATAIAVDAWITDQESQAQLFVSQLRNGGDANSATETDVRRVPGLPAAPLPLARLRMFVGPAIAAAATSMPAGSSAIYARQGRWYVLRVNSHEESVLANLDAVRSQVLIDYRRSQARAMLERYLEKLRREADVTLLLQQ